MTKRYLVLIFLLGGSLGVPVRAAEKKGVTMPDQIKNQGHTLVLNGLGVRKVTIVSVYVAGLYLEKATDNADEITSSSGPKRLVLHFLMGVSQGQLRDAWSRGFAKNCTTDCNAFDGEVQRLQGWMTDLRNGDEIVFEMSGETLAVTVKGELRGTLRKAGLPQRLMTLFVGPNPPNKSLKDGLLGLEK